MIIPFFTVESVAEPMSSSWKYIAAKCGASHDKSGTAIYYKSLVRAKLPTFSVEFEINQEQAKTTVQSFFFRF